MGAAFGCTEGRKETDVGDEPLLDPVERSRSQYIREQIPYMRALVDSALRDAGHDANLTSSKFTKAQQRLSDDAKIQGCWKSVGAMLEGPVFSVLVVLLVLLALCCSLALCFPQDELHDVKQEYQGEGFRHSGGLRLLSLCIFCVFAAEQALNLVVFGKRYAEKLYTMIDIIVVMLGLLAGVVLPRWVAFLVVIRLWKAVPLIF
eukprot:TRINITY_DN48689_c0_g1_i1.p1 TRINITY_DN48689_c0_g1~~TRINITY_DN48689_c0_g1_i1.p1  ORF type:complete len:204 (+),score=30.72 TRINITY_DN48689_c0_g1_i1:69-680(+)